ncbi:MAG: PAS domain-containing protein [Alphaproteobacteria bacterium]|nr:PAS domain-containing protein [Alphaproteobacteria bacterium]
MQDKRLVTRLENYWNLIRRGREMPEIQQLNPDTIEDMWQQCIQMGVFAAQGGTNYHYMFMGSQIVDLYGSDPTGQMMNPRASEYPLNILINKLDGIVASKAFLIDENQFINPRAKLVKYRACFMPFGSAIRGVTHIVIGFSGREF